MAQGDRSEKLGCLSLWNKFLETMEALWVIKSINFRKIGRPESDLLSI